MKPLLPNLQAALDIRQMNQADFARRMGWSEAKVSRLISGQTQEVKMPMLREIEQALGFSVAYLMDIEDVAQTAAERELLAQYRSAESRDRELASAALRPRNKD